MSIGRGRMYGDPPAEGCPATVAVAHARGELGFSGEVAPAVAFTDPAAGISDDLGRRPVQTSPPGTELGPIVGVVTRELVGGVRSAPAYETLREGVAFDGSHVTIANRHRSVVILAPVEQYSAELADQFPSLRVPPASDPLGRVCANAQAQAAAGGQS